MLAVGVSNENAVNNESAYIEFVIAEDSATITLYDADNNTIVLCEVPVQIDDGYFAAGHSAACGWDGTYTWRDTGDGVELERIDDGVSLLEAYGTAVIGDSFMVRVR
jgi:hypothetical protein